MILWFADYLSNFYHGFSVLQYITLRGIFAAMSSLAFTLIFGPLFIKWLRKMDIGQTVRAVGPQAHIVKNGTPTMGGILMIVAVFLSSIIWGKLDNQYLWILLFTIIGFGLIGFYDDYQKISRLDRKGMSALQKFACQSVIALLIGIYLYFGRSSVGDINVLIPFTKNLSIAIGVWYIVVTYFVIVGSSNAVNLSDGLDGLAILPTVIICAALGVFAYLTGHSVFASYLTIPFVSGISEIIIFISALIGAGLGFLWFNSYPAEIFMGDVGALALGAAMGVIAVLVRQEIVFFIMAGVFVAETVSVILQVFIFKIWGVRIFRMAPLHHHFELKGWAEPKVIVRFWIITLILVLIGLASLKIR